MIGGNDDYELRMYKVPKTLPHGNIVKYEVASPPSIITDVLPKNDGDLRKDEDVDLSTSRLSVSDKKPYDISFEANNITRRFRHCVGKHLLFITVTLPPKFYKFQSITQYDLSYNDLVKTLEVYSVQYVGSVELTEVGNVHYHLIVNVHDGQDKIHLINALKKKRTFGFIKISPDIQHHESLMKSAIYICKSLNETASIFYNRPNYRPDILFS